MYTGRQHKEPTSRVIGQPEGRGVQQFQVRDNREKSISPMKDLIQFKTTSYTPIGDKHCTVETTISNNKANQVKVDMKGNYGDFDGGTPSTKIAGWSWLSEDAKKTNWVRFHIWNQKLGGPGDDVGNLIPTTKAINSGSKWAEYENIFKSAAPQGIRFDVKVNGYYPLGGVKTGFPTGLTGSYTCGGRENAIDLSIPCPTNADLSNISPIQSKFLDELSKTPARNRLDIRELKTRYANRPWLDDEDDRLFDLVASHGENNWGVIAGSLDFRTKAQCFQRWNVLNPNISKERWTEEESEKLIQLVETGERVWNAIAKEMGNRTDIQCRYHYRQLMKNRENPSRRICNPQYLATL